MVLKHRLLSKSLLVASTVSRLRMWARGAGRNMTKIWCLHTRNLQSGDGRVGGLLASGAWSALWSNGWQEGEGTFGISWKGVQPSSPSWNHRLLLWEETSSFPPPSPFPPIPSSGLEVSGRESFWDHWSVEWVSASYPHTATHSTLWEEHESSVQVWAEIFTCLKRG